MCYLVLKITILHIVLYSTEWYVLFAYNLLQADDNERRNHWGRTGHLCVWPGRAGALRVPVRGLRARGEALHAAVAPGPGQHGRAPAPLLDTLSVQEIRQVSGPMGRG